MPNPQNRNDRRKGEERSETLIIPHITKEMLETARRMAEEGASRADRKGHLGHAKPGPARFFTGIPPGPTCRPGPAADGRPAGA